MNLTGLRVWFNPQARHGSCWGVLVWDKTDLGWPFINLDDGEGHTLGFQNSDPYTILTADNGWEEVWAK